ncbi:hypothetical protein [Desulfonatronovibrio hydrogenovorans]|uniref:hypothetical protein n=1 Tax=Desulfonatronovibrio hydrogenovorans TaxID=53245 RepID=UPI00048BDFCA|nr:hypothetical protein [Desulfonatronovibrio hydrogenovorans]
MAKKGLDLGPLGSMGAKVKDSKGKVINTPSQNNKSGKKKSGKGPGKKPFKAHGGPNKSNKTTPYSFIPRPGYKTAEPASHARLFKDRCDIAFEVEWTLVTPAALNPCTDNSEYSSMPSDNKDEYCGYNKRWLMLGGRFAISPFTVKSAVANGFVNLMGGCYRVITKEEGHPEKLKLSGNYPYNGGWKRYRVNMDHSRPGIITAIKEAEDGSRKISVQPVQEFYMDYPNPGIPLEKNGTCYASLEDRGPYRPALIKSLAASRDAVHTSKVQYHGPYRYGMDLQKGPGEGKKHHHRFFNEKGATLEGIIPRENFFSYRKMKKMVYMGGMKPEKTNFPAHDPWYEDLGVLKPGDFVYYQDFGGRITNVGKNFQFKALFFHEDAVPDSQKLCRNVESLCPRCSLFGMNDETESDRSGKDRAVGLKGRFKAAALISNQKVFLSDKPMYINQPVKAKLNKWIEEHGNEVASQALLPILGPPKPNKRDKDGYFSKESGKIKGAKIYKHFNLSGYDENTFRASNHRMEKLDYSNKLRNYAQVCNPGLIFSGVLGVENCSVKEAAALMILLEHSIAKHGFKLGLGKALGMGSATSRIKAVWIRKPDDYTWQKIEVDHTNLVEEAGKLLSGLKKEVHDMRTKHNKLHQLDTNKLPDAKHFGFPKEGSHYWKNCRP